MCKTPQHSVADHPGWAFRNFLSDALKLCSRFPPKFSRAKPQNLLQTQESGKFAKASGKIYIAIKKYLKKTERGHEKNGIKSCAKYAESGRIWIVRVFFARLHVPNPYLSMQQGKKRTSSMYSRRIVGVGKKCLPTLKSSTFCLLRCR